MTTPEAKMIAEMRDAIFSYMSAPAVPFNPLTFIEDKLRLAWQVGSAEPVEGELVRVVREFIAKIDSTMPKFLADDLAPIRSALERSPPADSRDARIREVVLEYYAALKRREHGGIAQDRAMNAIERIFGLNYDAYRDAAIAQEPKP